jgi:glucose/arabinose dehydrogenase
MSRARLLGIAGALAIAVSAPSMAAESAPASCGGFPRVGLKTVKGLCVGLVANHLGFARGIALSGDDVWIADMGGWAKGHGRLLRIRDHGRGKVEEMLTHVNMPNALVTLPDGKMLLGSLGRVDEFDPKEAQPGKVDLHPVVTGLPDKGRHPLPALAAAADGTLYINIGSATDHCEGASNAPPDAKAACPEIQQAPPRASIIAARWDHPPAGGLPAASAKVVARGLRNSMALAIAPASHLWAAVNARDFINLADPSLSDELLPPDTLVKVVDGSDYGWPYCYGMQIASPEYRPYDCKSKAAPTLLLPAHAAPLGMLYIDQTQPLGPYKQGLLIGYHGYRNAGHRIVWQALDAHGDIAGPITELVFGWDGVATSKSVDAFSPSGAVEKMGSPVALAQWPDGSVMITDDHNGALLLLTSEHQ